MAPHIGAADAATITEPSLTAALTQSLRDVALGTPTRPSWRGRLHLIALAVALPVLVVLTAESAGPRARLGVIIYAVGLCATFAVSTTYHRWVHTIRARAIWRRADHATIFAAIAGTFTPVCLLAVHGAWGLTLLSVVWAVALAGAIMKLTGWRHANIACGILYIGLSWAAAMVLMPAVWQRAGVWPVVLLGIGGLLYTAGALGFSQRWPTLRPAVFSYHEVWHALTIMAAAAHLAAVWTVTT